MIQAEPHPFLLPSQEDKKGSARRVKKKMLTYIHTYIHTYILLLTLPKKGFSAQYNTIKKYRFKFRLPVIKNISTIIITINMSEIF